MTINYKVNMFFRCLTPCPNVTAEKEENQIMVGSAACRECGCFVKKTGSEVECSFKE